MSLSSSAVWLIIVLVGAGTYLLRFSFIYLFGKIELPDSFTRALRFVPAAVLAALVAPALFVVPEATSWLTPRLVAAGVAVLVAWRTKSVLLTLLTGMGILWTLHALGWN